MIFNKKMLHTFFMGLFVLALHGCGGGGASEATNDPVDDNETAQEKLTLPNDPLFSEQWYLLNTGQVIGGQLVGTANVDIRAPEAWSVTKGSREVVIAVLDTGIAYDHPDLTANIWKNPGESGDGKESNGIDDDGNGYVDDWRGWDFVDGDNDPQDVRSKSILDDKVDIFHGTAVASLIAAQSDNGYGMSGIAPNVQIMPLRVLGQGASDADIAQAVAYARDMGAKIANMSFGSFVSG